MNYKQLGFKCGLEIHQQLDTRKLFCNCPSINSSSTPDIHFERKLRAVVGETGEIDVAAAHEQAKSKKYIYEADSKDCCLVEMDEEPPYPINKQAVKVALEIALLLKAKIVDEIQVMRKTVVDGSNVSGFQRTALIAYDGKIQTSKGKIKIPIILLEEEAAQKIETTDSSVKYRLDRLGIPLVEIATDAKIQDPEHAKEVAEKIGMILRSTGKVKRGIGTIRQDVNVSVKDRPRIELKGFQDLKSIPSVLDKEVERLIEQGKDEKPHVRKVEPDNTSSFLRPMPGAARMYPETDVIPLKPSIENIKLPELIETKAKRFEKLGLTGDLAKLMSKSDKVNLLERFTKQFTNIKPAFIASTLTSTLKEIKRKFNINVDKITETEFEEIFNQLDQGKISKDVIMDILIDYAKEEFKSFDKYQVAEAENLEQEIQDIIKQKPDLSIGAYMGIVMAKYKGKIDGQKVMELLKKLVKQ